VLHESYLHDVRYCTFPIVIVKSNIDRVCTYQNRKTCLKHFNSRYNDEKEKNMLSLIYVSTSVEIMNNDELLDILKKSHENNKAGNVTGMLLYKGGNFMQVLEGPDDVVNAIFEKVKKDPRHKDVMVISREQIQTRQFPSWEMAFQNLDNPAIKNEPGYSQFLQDDFTARVYRENPLRAYIMLLSFRDNIR
jgi:hypothetical protein